MKNIIKCIGLLVAFGLSAAPLQQNTYTVNPDPTVDIHVSTWPPTKA